MKNLLFPMQLHVVGWLLFVPAAILGFLIYFSLISCAGTIGTVLNDAVIIGITIGSIFLVCSKEKHEDEMIRSIRLASLLNAFYIYSIILITSVLLINGLAFIKFMTANLVLLPLIYVVVFRLEIHRYNKMSKDEE